MGLVTWFVLTVGLSLPANSQVENMENKESLETITLGAGCFWCVEAVFEQLDGVHSAVSGYMGGHIKILATGRYAPDEPAMQKWYK